MELFISTVFVVLILILVITIFRAPREIFGNFLKFIGRLLMMCIPFASFFYRTHKDYKAMEKEDKEREEILSKTDHPLVLQIEPTNFKIYLIIFGTYSREAIDADLFYCIENSSPRININWAYIEKEDYMILELSQVPDLLAVMHCTHELSRHYGTDRTFSYLTSDVLSFFCQTSNENPYTLIGKTNKEQTFAFTSMFDTKYKNSLLLQPSFEINKKLNTDFFCHLILND